MILCLKNFCRRFYAWAWVSVLPQGAANPPRIQHLSLIHILYGHDQEEFSAALTRHLMFFNTEGIWGSVVHGIALAMEEQRAMGAPVPVEAITGIKAGLKMCIRDSPWPIRKRKEVSCKYEFAKHL